MSGRIKNWKIVPILAMKQLLHIHFISGFPDFFTGFIEHSIVKKAIQNNHVKITNVNLRDYGINRLRQIDDYQYGPGKGMVLRPEPVFWALQAIKKTIKKPVLTILLTPQGRQFNQVIARTWAQTYDHLILIAGHYEGFDERIRSWVDYEISLGDYILSNGEIAILAVADAIIRLRPGVIAPESVTDESFSSGLLDYPVYTKPVSFQNQQVPEVLRSGHHAKIRLWRHKAAFLRTLQRRPDLISQRKLTEQEQKWFDLATKKV